MPRRIELTLPAAKADRLVRHALGRPGIAGIMRHPGASLAPPADTVVIDGTIEAVRSVLAHLAEEGLARGEVMRLSEPLVLVAPAEKTPLERETNEANWEEIGQLLRTDTQPSVNFLLLMALAGAIAAFGLVTDTLHVVVGGMLVAPGFEPILRGVFGLLGHRHSFGAGLRATLAGYAALAAGAAAALPLALHLHGLSAAELSGNTWVRYWSSIQGVGIATALLAGVAGGILVSTRETVFATGVMVALALVPTMALVGMGFVAGDWAIASGGLSRWASEVACVALGGGPVLLLKRIAYHRRPTWD